MLKKLIVGMLVLGSSVSGQGPYSREAVIAGESSVVCPRLRDADYLDGGCDALSRDTSRSRGGAHASALLLSRTSKGHLDVGRRRNPDKIVEKQAPPVARGMT